MSSLIYGVEDRTRFVVYRSPFRLFSLCHEDSTSASLPVRLDVTVMSPSSRNYPFDPRLVFFPCITRTRPPLPVSSGTTDSVKNILFVFNDLLPPLL